MSLSLRKSNSIRRKVAQALVVFEGVFDNHQIYWERKKESIDLTLYFRYSGVKYRFDKEFFNDKLPSVDTIRQELWRVFIYDKTFELDATKFHTHSRPVY